MEESPGGLAVKDSVLSTLWLRSLLLRGFDPGRKLLHAMGTAKKKKNFFFLMEVRVYLLLSNNGKATLKHHPMLLCSCYLEINIQAKCKQAKREDG